MKRKPNKFFVSLVNKYFGDDRSKVYFKISEYLKEIDEVATDSSIIYHVFNEMSKTKFTGSFGETWKKAMWNAGAFFPMMIEGGVEKFVVASLLKFQIAREIDEAEGRGRDYWLSAAKEVMNNDPEDAKEKELRAEVLGLYKGIMSIKDI